MEYLFSSQSRPSRLLFGKDQKSSPIADTDAGPAAYADVSLGPVSQQWTIAKENNGDVILTATDGASFTLFTDATISELSFTFDQLGRPVVAYKNSSGVYVWSFDSDLSQNVHRFIGIGDNPLISMDLKLNGEGISDVVLWYRVGNKAKRRLQRYRYNSENEVTAPNFDVIRLKQFGMGENGRMCLVGESYATEDVTLECVNTAMLSSVNLVAKGADITDVADDNPTGLLTDSPFNIITVGSPNTLTEDLSFEGQDVIELDGSSHWALTTTEHYMASIKADRHLGIWIRPITLVNEPTLFSIAGAITHDLKINENGFLETSLQVDPLDFDGEKIFIDQWVYISMLSRGGSTYITFKDKVIKLDTDIFQPNQQHTVTVAEGFNGYVGDFKLTLDHPPYDFNVSPVMSNLIAKSVISGDIGLIEDFPTLGQSQHALIVALPNTSLSISAAGIVSSAVNGIINETTGGIDIEATNYFDELGMATNRDIYAALITDYVGQNDKLWFYHPDGESFTYATFVFDGEIPTAFPDATVHVQPKAVHPDNLKPPRTFQGLFFGNVEVSDGVARTVTVKSDTTPDKVKSFTAPPSTEDQLFFAWIDSEAKDVKLEFNPPLPDDIWDPDAESYESYARYYLLKVGSEVLSSSISKTLIEEQCTLPTIPSNWKNAWGWDPQFDFDGSVGNTYHPAEIHSKGVWPIGKKISKVTLYAEPFSDYKSFSVYDRYGRILGFTTTKVFDIDTGYTKVEINLLTQEGSCIGTIVAAGDPGYTAAPVIRDIVVEEGENDHFMIASLTDTYVQNPINSYRRLLANKGPWSPVNANTDESSFQYAPTGTDHEPFEYRGEALVFDGTTFAIALDVSRTTGSVKDDLVVAIDDVFEIRLSVPVPVNPIVLTVTDLRLNRVLVNQDLANVIISNVFLTFVWKGSDFLVFSQDADNVIDPHSKVAHVTDYSPPTLTNPTVWCNRGRQPNLGYIPEMVLDDLHVYNDISQWETQDAFNPLVTEGMIDLKLPLTNQQHSVSYRTNPVHYYNPVGVIDD